MALNTCARTTPNTAAVSVNQVEDTVYADTYLLNSFPQYLIESHRYAPRTSNTPLELLRCTVPIPGNCGHIQFMRNTKSRTFHEDNDCGVIHGESNNTAYEAVLPAISTDRCISAPLLLLSIHIRRVQTADLGPGAAVPREYPIWC